MTISLSLLFLIGALVTLIACFSLGLFFSRAYGMISGAAVTAFSILTVVTAAGSLWFIIPACLGILLGLLLTLVAVGGEH